MVQYSSTAGASAHGSSTAGQYRPEAVVPTREHGCLQALLLRSLLLDLQKVLQGLGFIPAWHGIIAAR
jgi:hypothetical protein